MIEPEKNDVRRISAPRKKVEIRLTATQAEKLRGLWHDHSGPLHAMLVGWCGDPQNASDVLQEVFRRLAGAPGLMLKMNNPRAFLAVSARRIAVDFARRGATRAAYHAAAGTETPASENPGPTDENLRAVIAEALDGLPAEQRSVFEHKILNGKTLDEISRLEGVSLNTVASRLRYALDKIRGQLRPYYDDLNRKDFKNMKNDLSNTENIASQRIITPLAPKRVPSVAPGLEGLAAMAPDACEAAPEIEVSEPEFVESLPANELVEPEIANCGVGGNAWEQFAVPVAVELPADNVGAAPDGEFAVEDNTVTDEMPEMVTCEILPPAGEVPLEWLDHPDNFFVTLFDGEFVLGADGNDGIEVVDGERVPFDFESGFEICVLPVPEEFLVDVDPNELLLRYYEFLRENPDWDAPDPDVMEAQVVTPSGYFSGLEFGTPSKAAAFDSWYTMQFKGSDGSTTGGEINDDGYGTDLGDVSSSFDPKDLMVCYQDFLRENPDWGALDPDMMEIQVVTQSSHFGELEFGTPSKAAAFDNWYVTIYSQDTAQGSTNLGGSSDSEYGTVVSEDLYSGGKDFLKTTGVITDTRNDLTGIPAEWTRCGTVNTGVLVLSGGGPIAAGGGSLSLNSASNLGGTGDFVGGAVVTGGEIVLSDGVTMDQADGNTLILSNGSRDVLEGDQVLSGGKFYANNPVIGADKEVDIEMQGVIAALPMEVAIVEKISSFGNAAVGLAPTADQALIVEFGVLSPSEAPQAPQVSTLLRATDDLPQAIVSSDGGALAASNSEGLSAAEEDASSPDDVLRHVTASAQESAPASIVGIKVDAPTAAAGAVAAGTVVHGGAVAPAIRRPLPTL